jgi:photosystem II stability/assembly factor-like uncharacterized protein
LRTDDAGKTWKDQESSINMSLFAVAAANRNDAIAVGEQGRLLRTKNGGETWELQPTLTSAPLYGVAFIGGNDAWVAGRGGTILKRTQDVQTMELSRPRLRPTLKLSDKIRQQQNNSTKPALIDDDIPRAVPTPKPK